MSDDLAKLQQDLGTIPYHSGRFVNTALRRTAHEVKEAWRDHASGPSGSHAKAYPYSIDYDVEGTWPQYKAEIGPNLGRKQGALGILEDAPGGVTASPQSARPKLMTAAEADFEKGLDAAVGDALKRAGLG